MKDLLALQSNMNKLLTEQNENFKVEINLLRNLIEPCISYIQRFNDFEKRIQENMANLNMQSLIFEERLCKLEKYVDKNQISKKLFDSLANKLPTLDKKITAARNEYDGKFESISGKVSKDNNKVLANISLLKLNNEAALQNIEQLRKIMKSTSHSNTQDIPPAEGTKKSLEISGNVLMFFDSDGKFLKPELLNKEKKCQQIFTPNIMDIKEKLENAKISATPEKIIINVGINNLKSNKADEITKMYEEIIKFKSWKIYISTILQRKDSKYISEIKHINNFLVSISQVNDVIIINHCNITTNMMYDAKHLNGQGFFTLLTNIKYVLFGFLPTFKRRSTSSNKKKYSQEQNRY